MPQDVGIRKRRPRRTATIRKAIIARMDALGLNALDVSKLAKVSRTVVYDFVGPNNRDIGLSHAERIWTALGLDVKRSRR